MWQTQTVVANKFLHSCLLDAQRNNKVMLWRHTMMEEHTQLCAGWANDMRVTAAFTVWPAISKKLSFLKTKHTLSCSKVKTHTYETCFFKIIHMPQSVAGNKAEVILCWWSINACVASMLYFKKQFKPLIVFYRMNNTTIKSVKKKRKQALMSHVLQHVTTDVTTPVQPALSLMFTLCSNFYTYSITFILYFE